MLGKDLYKVQGMNDLNSDQLRSLISLYRPLVSNNAIILYQELLVNPKGQLLNINDLLVSLGLSLDDFILSLEHLNEYRLVDTYYEPKEDHYLFELKAPKNSLEFMQDNLFGRLLLNEIKAERYQNLYRDIYSDRISLDAYENKTKHLKISSLNQWNKELEKDFKPIKTVKSDIQSFFDMDRFLKEASQVLFPYKFRTQQNLEMIARYADLYNISQDRMRTILQKVIKPNSESFDLSYLRYLCMNTKSDYMKVEKGEYDVPCLSFLMNLQNGKEVSPADKGIIDALANQYHLNPSVINFLIEYSLKTCDNHLFTNYIYPIASDFHRNDIKTVEQAQQRLSNTPKKEKDHPKDILPKYDQTNKLQYDEKLIDDYFKSLKE